MTTALVPAETLRAYDMEGATVSPFGDGMVNVTYLAEASDTQLIVQDMSPIFQPDIVDGFEIVTAHLTAKGWEVPRIVKTADDQNHLPGENGRFWRVSTLIESDRRVPELKPDLMAQMGGLLARLHVDLADLDYTPPSGLPHFHDTDFFMSRLDEILPRLPDEATRTLAMQVANEYQSLPPIDRQNQQLIHADPRAGNMLFRDEAPFTFIDFDTLMEGPIWLDIGDFLRTLGEEESLRGREIGRSALERTVEAYREIARPEEDPETFFRQSVDAARTIACELAARFLIDVVDDNYFAWENSGYASRREFVAARAILQWNVYQDLTGAKQAAWAA